MRNALLFTSLLLASTSSNAKTWIGLDAGYQQASSDSSLSETEDKTGFFGMLGVSYTFETPYAGLEVEPSLSVFWSSLSGATACCGTGTIDTQAVLAELPVVYYFGETGFRVRPGVMVGDDLNFNILPSREKGEVRFSIGADAFRTFEWMEQDFRYGVKITALPTEHTSLMAGLFMQMGFGAESTATPTAVASPTPTPTPEPVAAPAAAPEKSLSTHSVEVVGNDVKVTLPKDRVRFEVSKSTMNAEDQAFVDSLAKAFLRVASQYDYLLITGHSDKTGREASNIKLSKDRAEAVARVFRKAGAKPSMIKVEGRGSKEPIKEGDTEEAYVWNRRVEVYAVQVKDKDVVVRELTEGLVK